jgi:acyl-CoA thioester hydrolase
VHLFPVRVYYEDTDLSGIVYYANYLKFMERARSDLLALLGVDQRAAWEAGEGAYAVAAVNIAYRSPARLEDALTIATRPLEVGAASIRLEQRITRGDDLLTEATVRVGFLSPEGRPRRQPAAWRTIFARHFAIPRPDDPA